MGDSIGQWEGDTLVVDTTNFTSKTQFRGSGENLHVVERFTPHRARHDPLPLHRRRSDHVGSPWTGEYPWNASDENLYEYACHEGNYALGGMLRGARQKEGDEAAKKSSSAALQGCQSHSRRAARRRHLPRARAAAS